VSQNQQNFAESLQYQNHQQHLYPVKDDHCHLDETEPSSSCSNMPLHESSYHNSHNEDDHPLLPQKKALLKEVPHVEG
jgi:hypothetical protein